MNNMDNYTLQINHKNLHPFLLINFEKPYMYYYKF